MTKTLFSKLMLAFIVIIVITTVVSAFLISTMMKNQQFQRTSSDMINTAQEINELAQMKAQGVITSEEFLAQILIKAKLNQDVIWVVEDNNIWVTSDESSESQITEETILKYYGNMVEDILKGNTVTNISESGDAFFHAPVITVGAPIYVENQIVGSVFIHKALSALTNSLNSIYREIIQAALISGIAAVILCYFFTRNLLRPLGDVSDAAKELAKGNFDVRIEDYSQDEIGQLAQTFNTVAVDLGKFENTRRSFVANVSHELRSPLTSMQGLVQGVLDGTIHEEDRTYYLNVVLEEIKRLNILINDLLDLARIESGTFPMNIRRVDINELIRRALITFESKITQNDISVHVEIGDGKDYVMADADRIAQVLVNLIDNAVKFTPKGGRLDVFTAMSEVSVFVNIRNSGEPIPQEDIPYLFERFYKADKSRSRESQGTGLGLSIANRILKQHGQKIWVSSDADTGTTFTFTLKKG